MTLPPFPVPLTGAEIRITGDTLTVSVHGLSIQRRMEPLLAEAVWERFGVRPGQVAVEIASEHFRVELTRTGITVHIWPYLISKVLLFAWRRALGERELAARAALSHEEEAVHVA